MATYKEIQGYVKKHYGHSVKSCWIAHMKELLGLPVKKAPNRISDDSRTNPCPEDKRACIKDAFSHFGMLQ